MVEKKKTSEWYQDWFQEDYLALYPNRDENQAICQVEALLEKVFGDQANIDWSKHSILDLGCGTGRHLRALQAKFSHSIGMDLSPVLLQNAQQHGTNRILRGDFRALPFEPESFKLVCSFFSSFGYFKTAQQDWDFFNNICSLVSQEGYLFLDLPNGPYTVSHLPPDDEKTLSSGTYTQKRRWDGECIRKRIKIVRPDGQEEHFEEQLRLFSFQEIESAFSEKGFEIISVFGNEHGEDYNRNQMPRMSFLVRKTSIIKSSSEG